MGLDAYVANLWYAYGRMGKWLKGMTPLSPPDAGGRAKGRSWSNPVCFGTLVKWTCFLSQRTGQGMGQRVGGQRPARTDQPIRGDCALGGG
jgi:hypothetical protein